MSNRTADTFNVIMGISDEGVVILEDLFQYSDDFTGATGVVVRPVSQDEIKEAMAEKRNYLRELCDELDAHGDSRRAVMNMPKDEYLESRFESYRTFDAETIHTMLKDAQLVERNEPTPERYTYSSLGRIFPRALQGIRYVPGVEDSILPLIKQYEKNSDEWAAIEQPA